MFLHEFAAFCMMLRSFEGIGMLRSYGLGYLVTSAFIVILYMMYDVL